MLTFSPAASCPAGSAGSAGAALPFKREMPAALLRLVATKSPPQTLVIVPTQATLEKLGLPLKRVAKNSVAASSSEVAAVCGSHHLLLMFAAASGADAGSETRSERWSPLQVAHQQDHQVSIKE